MVWKLPLANVLLRHNKYTATAVKSVAKCLLNTCWYKFDEGSSCCFNLHSALAAVFVLQIFSLFFNFVPEHYEDRLKHVLIHPIKAHVNGPLPDLPRPEDVCSESDVGDEGVDNFGTIHKWRHALWGEGGYQSVTNSTHRLRECVTKGRGGGPKTLTFCVTSFMDGPSADGLG